MNRFWSQCSRCCWLNQKRVRKNLKRVTFISVFLIATAASAGEAPKWKAEWEKALEAAKKEGQLTLYGSPEFEGLFGEFHKKYPEIKITGVFNRGADVAKRLMAERRADKFLADLYVNGMTTGYNVFYKAKALDPIPPQLVLPEVTDASKWWRGKLHYVDPENQYLLNINGENRMVVAFNTKLVNPAEIKSYWICLIPSGRARSSPTIRRSADRAMLCVFSIIAKVLGLSSSNAFSWTPISSSAPIRVKWAIGWRAESLRSQFLVRFHGWTWT